jgi:hypothetical protein
MVDVAHLFNLFAQYAETSRDFLIRVGPRRFAQEVRTSKHAYLKPFQFVVISLVISAVSAFTVAAFMLVGSARETLFHIGVLGCLVITVGIWLENLFLIAAAKLATFVLGISAPISDLLDGYCYASVLFPLFIIATEAALLGRGKAASVEVAIVSVVQLVFLGLACVAMTSFVSMHPRYSWRTSFGTFAIVMILSFAILAITDQLETPDFYEVHPLSAAERVLEHSFLAPHFSLPTCDSVTLIGDNQVNDAHDEVTVWFEWGETPALGNITVTQRFTTSTTYYQLVRGLKANTTYYYRSVGSSKNGSSKGQIISFTTSKC